MKNNATKQVVRDAMKAVSRDVRAPKCVRDGIVKPKSKKKNTKGKQNSLNSVFKKKLMGDPDKWEFNLNSYMYVKLNEKGFKYWHEIDSDHIPDNIKVNLEGLKRKADKDGYVEFQLWNFMQIFGDEMYHVGEPLFETTVRFNKKDINCCQ